MDAIKTAVDFVLGLGPAVMLPIILTLFGLILGQGLTRSLRAGLTIGVGFVGINLVIGLFFDSLGPAARTLVENFDVQLDILDVGWPIGAAISFGTPVAPLLIPLVLLINMGLIAVNFTKTMDVDIWNYWHFIFAASVAYYAYNNMILALAVGVVTAIITFKLADWTAPVLEHHFGLPGISLPHAETVNFAPIMYTLERLWAKIPFLANVKADPDTVQKRFGLLGEPLTMGLVLGLIIGILGGNDLGSILVLGIQMAAVLVLLPKMVAILMEGLIPLSEGAREFIMKRFPGKDVYIGLDAAIVIGHPAGMAVALLMVPITIVLAVILPYNRMLPFADFAVLPFTMVWAVAAARGNIVRGLLNGIVTMLIVLYLATEFAPLATEMGQAVGFDFPEGASLISGIDVGSHVIPWIIIKLIDFRNRTMFFVAIGVAVVYAALWLWVRNDIKKQYATEETEAR